MQAGRVTSSIVHIQHTKLWLLLMTTLSIAACVSSTIPERLVGLKAAPAMPPAEAIADPLFSKPYIDIDVWRQTPVPHRYVHGGFADTETRFSFYFPPESQYHGRFFQHITPIPDSENLAQTLPPGSYNRIGFAIDSGAYFVETNGGGKVDYSVPGGTLLDPTITAYRANAAAARYSRAVAQTIYVSNARPYGYAYGGSGGGYRTIGSMENTDGVWDGAVPYVIGSTMAIPNMFSVRMHAMRILKDKFANIVDAMEPGGSGNPYANLTTEESAALREVSRMGFPLPAWFGHKTMGIHGFAALYQGVVATDPTYFTDFWTTPGYLGFDKPETFDGHRLQLETTVVEAITAAAAARLEIVTNPFNSAARGGVDNAFKQVSGEEADRIVAFRLARTPPAVDFLGGDLMVLSGNAKGTKLTLARIVDNIVVLGLGTAATAKRVEVGDTIRIENSNFLAAQTYHRHQVPGTDFPAWDQFRSPDGNPIFPQRSMLIGPLFVQATAGSTMTGMVDEKMIIVASLWDREALPWQADWYRQRVAQYHGAKANDYVRLYYTEHALHGDELLTSDKTRVVSYRGILQQALRDLAAWVEDGVEPPASTRYEIVDSQVVVPSDANNRYGIQPTVNLTVNGRQRIDVEAGETVRFEAVINAPQEAGTIVTADWDFDGSGEFSIQSKVPLDRRSLQVSQEHTFDTPGTYFPALRSTLQREGNRNTAYARISNLGRIRVVVR